MNDLDRDVLMENLARFEDEVFRKTLSTAHRVRRTRLAVRYGTTLVLTLSIAALLWFPRSQETTLVSTSTAPVAEKSSPVVILRSKEFAGVIHTQPLRPDQTLLSNSRRFAVTRTADSHPEITRVNDDQLLALFEGKAVALVGRGPNATLIFPAEAE